jgi:hypothetical protein
MGPNKQVKVTQEWHEESSAELDTPGSEKERQLVRKIDLRIVSDFSVLHSLTLQA